MGNRTYLINVFSRFVNTSGSITDTAFNELTNLLEQFSKVVSEKSIGGTFVDVVETRYEITRGAETGQEFILRYQVRNPHTQEGTEFAYTFFKA
ncbi:hypothetical protein TSARBOMBA_149 [Bacillus phage TsarBomba]|uniref:Uncharacterized protein n=1 Tax=Bacillus phage TsarBomba TaxID=1690456 RepID=A0A0K2D0D4_9CAUD|nr:hypothetical protein TSARBOMBA_149 [Bacillus phage TsarBomba]ALA13183.1 hypothetical protein TSARBOMBA_149 [Bacillus phage TsarBomba]